MEAQGQQHGHLLPGGDYAILLAAHPALGQTIYLESRVEDLRRWPERLALLRKRLLVPPSTTAERNAYFLYLEIVFAAILGAAGSFNAAYVLRLGGSNTLIGLLSALPSLLAVFIFLPAAHILERQNHYMPWIVGSLLLTRSGYVLIVLLPFFLQHHVAEVTAAILIAMTIPSVFFSTGWSPMLSDVIPPQSRATVLAWRSILNSATVAPMIFIMGRWLDRVPFPANYQGMYAVGFLAGAYSVYLVSRIRPAGQGAPPKPQGRVPWWASVTGALEHAGFRRIVVNTLLFNLGAWMVGPLYIIFFVRQLGASDGWIGLNGTLANIGVIVGYWLWRKVVRRLGEGKCLLVALPLACIYPFLVALVPHLNFILLAGFLISAINPGVDLSHGIIFLDLLPEGKKHSSTAVYSMVMNIGAFLCPLAGVALAEAIGIVPTLLIGGVLRALGAAMFYLWPVTRSAVPAKAT